MHAEEWTEIVGALAITVRDVRRLLGWSQQHLARQAFVSQGSISRMENGNCDALPFHSVVVVLRTLAAGAATMRIPLSPAARHLLAFAPAMNGAFVAIEPPDPDLTYIAHTLGRIVPRRRPAFLAIVRAAVAAFNAEEPLPDPLPDVPPATTLED